MRDDFCVVQIDLGAGLSDESGTLAIVTLLGAAALRAATLWSSPDAELDLADPFVKRGIGRLQTALDRFGPQLTRVTDVVTAVRPVLAVLGPTGAVTAAGAATTGSVLRAADKLRRDLVRGPLAGRVPRDRLDDAEAVVEAVNEILQELAVLSGRPPLLLAEGLDKRTELDSVRLALGDAGLLRSVNAALVLTGPIHLRHDPQFKGLPGDFELGFLHNVGVRRAEGAGGQPAPDGIATMVAVYRKRVDAFSLPTDLVAGEALEAAALASSGIMREFFLLLRLAAKSAYGAERRHIRAEDVGAAIRLHRIRLQGYLNEARLELLRRVLTKGTLPANPDADVLLFENVIACYANGDLWFRPHEVLVDYVAGITGDP